MARSLPVENLFTLNADNGVRDGSSNWLAITPHPSQGSNPWALLAWCKCIIQILKDLQQTDEREHATFGMSGQHTDYAATQAICFQNWLIYPINHIY